jgi:hypothetical protein
MFVEYISHNQIITAKSKDKCILKVDCELDCYQYEYGNKIKNKKDDYDEEYDLT